MESLYILLAVGLGFGLAYFYFKRKQTPDSFSDQFFNQFNQKFPEILNQANQNLVSMANQNLDSKKQEIRTDMENKNQSFEKLVDRVLSELDKNQKKLETAETSRIGNFNALKQELESHKKITQELSVTTEGLKKVLSNNQLRGAFGEKVAEDLLKMSGFIKGIDYEFNKQMEGAETRPDFCVFLPDGAKINVDSKFPYSNLTKMSESQSKSEKLKYLKNFKTDVKQKIKQVVSREYIDPSGKTVDFVILFIPNEMIFSFIYDKMPEVWQEALEKKVVFAGPFSFTAILRMVRQAYDNFKIQKNTHQIIEHIKKFSSEFEKYNAEFGKIGTKIDSLSNQYDKVNSTRTRQLQKVVDKISLEGPDQIQPPKTLVNVKN